MAASTSSASPIGPSDDARAISRACSAGTSPDARASEVATSPASRSAAFTSLYARDGDDRSTSRATRLFAAVGEERLSALAV
ncbi:MAG: hypothetical protein OXF00_11795 [bacterium]|nr:hypothetical protein [bacterium]